MSNINWSKYFDRIYCLFYIPYKERKQLMQFQLNRIGILNSGIFEWHYNYGSPLDKKFEDYVRTQTKLHNTRTVSFLLSHYYTLRDAYTNGYQRVLIIEDDARFLRDTDLIQKHLQNRPQNSDFIMYDKSVSKIDLVRIRFKTT